MALYCDKEKYNYVSVIYPAALYVDVFSIEDDGTEIKAFP